MNTNADYLRDFLSHMGVRADIRFDDSHEKLIVIADDDYNCRRAQIETWFTLIHQENGYSYFRERLRGAE